MSDWTPPNLDYPPPKAGEPPLHRAARLGDADAIRALHAEGADLNAPFDISLDPGSQTCFATPLMIAAGSGDGASVDTVRLLLELGADLTVEIESRTAASFACDGLGWNYRPGGDVDRLRLLFEAGCPLAGDPKAANRLFSDVAGSGDVARLRLLLDRGLDPNGYWAPESAREEEQDFVESMKGMMGGTDFFSDLPEELQAEMRERSLQMDQEFRQRNASAPYSFEIPLHCAAESGNPDCVALLLEAGADPMRRDNSQETAMYAASSLPVIELLKGAGVPIEDANWLGWSPLNDAVADGDLNRIRALLEGGANVNATHDHGYTVFMSAAGAIERSPDVLRLLAEFGADPHAVSDYGYNAFHAAIDVNGEANEEASVRGILTFLRESGVDLEARNDSGQTPLARAIVVGTAIEVSVLCELGANPNAVGLIERCGADHCEQDALPLLFHAVTGSGVDKDSKTEALLRAGADPLARDAEGYLALDLAVSRLCAGAADYGAAFEAFYDGAPAFPDPGKDKGHFITIASAEFLRYTETFAADLPLPDSSYSYAEEWQQERIRAVAHLCAYTEWAQGTEDAQSPLE